MFFDLAYLSYFVYIFRTPKPTNGFERHVLFLFNLQIFTIYHRQRLQKQKFLDFQIPKGPTTPHVGQTLMSGKIIKSKLKILI